MTSAASTTTRDPEAKREAILDGALALFSHRGFHGTAVPEVAEKAKVAAGTIYRYFESKEALVNALYQREKEALGLALLTDLPIDAAPRAQLKHFVSRAFKFARENPLGLAFLELHHHQDYLDEKSRALETKMFEPAFAFIAMAQKAGLIKPLPGDFLIALVWGMFTGIMRAHNEGRVTLDPVTINHAEDCCWEAIRA